MTGFQVPLHLAGASVIVMACSSLPALAQSGQSPDDGAVQGSEVIVVTATRRAVNQQDVPISVTAVTQQALINSGVASTEQISQVTPNLTVVQNSTQLQYNIRGVSSRGVYAGDENGNAVYLDGIYQPLPYGALFDLVEVDRVEVLRGPQGTLFGRNATGGLINIITPDPSFELAAHLRARYGRFGEYQVQGYFTAPFSDTVAFDVAANVGGDRGYIKNLVHGGNYGDRQTYTLRSKLLIQPTDGWKSVITVSYSQSEDQSAVFHQPFKRRTSGAAIPGNIVPQEPNQGAAAAPPWEPFMNNRMVNVSIKNAFDLGGVTLEATSAYMEAKSENLTDYDFTPARLSDILSTQDDKVLQGELRLVSSDDGPLQWTAGVFGFKTNNKYDPFIFYLNGNPLFTHRARNRTTSWAAFAEGTYELTETLNITLGGRYSWEKRKFDYVRTGLGAGTGNAENSWTSFTPRVSVQFELSSDANVYATWSRGFKSGLFDTPSNRLIPINEEKLDAWEVGFKTDPLNWLRINGAVYYYKYKDIQVTGLDPASGTSRLLNAAAATNWGGELELSAVPSDGLNLRLGVGYTNAEFDSFRNATYTNPLPSGANQSINCTATSTDPRCDLEGKPMFRAPKWTVTAGLDYETDVSFGKAGFSASAYYSSKYYFEPAYRVWQEGYIKLGGQIWVEPRENVRLALWSENLTNENIGRTILPTGGGDYVTWQRPRSYGVSLDFRY